VFSVGIWYRFKWAWHVACIRERRCAYRNLVVKPEKRRPLGRSRRRWENNIKEDLPAVERGDIDWIDLTHDRGRWHAFEDALMNNHVL
jgi:hypothetical protein